MRRVIVESPYAGKTPEDIAANVAYARACVRECVLQGDAPLASHLLFTQEGILDDNDVRQRALGMNAGFAWTAVADLVVVYTDRGVSSGMKAGVELAEKLGIPVEYRQLTLA